MMRGQKPLSIELPSGKAVTESALPWHLITMTFGTPMNTDATVLRVAAERLQNSAHSYALRHSIAIGQAAVLFYCLSAFKSGDDSRDLVLQFLEVHFSTCFQSG